MIPVLTSPNDLAVESAFLYEQGPVALANLKAEVVALGGVASEAKGAADKVISELSALGRLEVANREERTRQRSEKLTEDSAAFDKWGRGKDASFAEHAARSSAQALQIEYLTQRDIYATNTLRPRLRLASQRADAAMFLATANLIFAQSLIAGIERHAALQKTVETDGIAQIPSAGGRANDLLRQAIATAGRSAEISASADSLQAQIAIREEGLL